MPKQDTKYLRQRGGWWHFVKRIPSNGKQIRRACHTKNLKEAQKKRDLFIEEMDSALQRRADIHDAWAVRKQYMEASEEGRDILATHIITDDSETIAAELGVLDAFHGQKDELEWTDEDREPFTYYETATGQLTPFTLAVPHWLESLPTKGTKINYRRAFDVLMKHYSHAEELTWERCGIYLKRTGPLEGVSSATVMKWKGAYVNFWEWINKDPKLWQGHRIPKTKKIDKLPWDPQEVVELYRTLQQRNDATSGWLQHVVWIAAHTGARQAAIAELIYYPEDEAIFFPKKKFEKTGRTIPAHPAIRNNLTVWMKNKKSRSTIKNRFIEFKDTLGYGNQKNFHSFRRTFVTEMENLRVEEGIVADIVGHRKGTITYGLYGGGYRLEEMRREIIKLDYGYHP